MIHESWSNTAWKKTMQIILIIGDNRITICEYPIKYNIVLYNISWKFTKTIIRIYDFWDWNGSNWFSQNISYNSATINGYKGRIHQYKSLEMPGIDPGTSHMLSERSTIWATPPWGLTPTGKGELSTGKGFIFK